MIKFSEYIKRFITDLGLEINDIPENPDRKTPDFIMADDNSKYLLELKTKIPDQDLVNARNAELEKGNLHTEVIQLGPKNRFSGIIKHGVDQLNDFANDDSTFRMLWLFCDGFLSSTYFELYHATLYGATNLIDWDGGLSRTAYYVYNSDFYHLRKSLDGAFISTTKDVKLCLNNYSPRYGALKKSSLIGKFKGGVEDPLTLEHEGNAYVADIEIDRKDQSGIMNYLRGKYDLPEKTMFMNMRSNTFTIPVKDHDGT